MRVFGRALGFGNHHAPQVGAGLVIRPLHLAWRARLQLKAQRYRIVVVHDGDGVTGLQSVKLAKICAWRRRGSMVRTSITELMGKTFQKEQSVSGGA